MTADGIFKTILAAIGLTGTDPTSPVNQAAGKKAGRPLKHFKDRPATAKERVYASRARRKQGGCFETCFETPPRPPS